MKSELKESRLDRLRRQIASLKQRDRRAKDRLDYAQQDQLPEDR